MTTKQDTKPTASISNVASVTDALTEVLADTYRLVLKSHIYHWNVTGPLFVSVHDLTEEHYRDMFTAADVLAERIRALGKVAMIAPANLAAGADGRDADANLPAKEMIADLRDDHDRLAARMRALVGTAEAADDPVTADLATTRADFHEKAAWMLRALAT
ncbi:DNA starvation/stationary phase protection protein [Roseovarius sp. SCSIO 43702]|uniref:Dps family protein n=1 Tax=Roseovarius sp. SCSIO 43702 TaxID=2823043 RepID=UPI001C72B887|nr:DNA starvation/stationary phase protection protein [Roseovarius sp. SCSIO 43702]QYX57159.1 DNA starvation/stationary phase protection protein [Roseovarius sp. SCSIO 43702]